MKLITKIKSFKKISKKTNPFIFGLQLYSVRLFKKPLFKKIKINGLFFNTTDCDDIRHITEYINNYYDIENIKNINTCIDVGANSGDFSIMLSNKCKQIYAVEPIGYVYQKINKNINDNNIKNIKIYNFGLSSSCGKANLSIPKNHTGASKIDDTGDYEIKLVSWSKFYEVIGKPKNIDLLKIDCEGCEYSLLKDSDILNYVKEIRMEFHIFNEKDKENAKKLIYLFNKKGFKIKNSIYSKLKNEKSENLEIIVSK